MPRNQGRGNTRGTGRLLSLHFSLFRRQETGPKFAPATARPSATYKTTPIPIRIEVAVNFSRFDFYAEEDWLPGRGAQRDEKERYRTPLTGIVPSRSPTSWARTGRARQQTGGTVLCSGLPRHRSHQRS